ncbi:MAG: hypothetical protein AAF771_00605 [Pseudomonadota bacterium]
MWPRRIGLLLACLAIIGVATLQISGLFAWKRHIGYLAPVWGEDAQTIYAIRRDTGGIVWGLGWEFFTGPANALVLRDRYTLLSIVPETGISEPIAAWGASPLLGQRLRTYRGRIFTQPGARILPVGGGLDVRLRVSIPRVPISEVWQLDAIYTAGQPFPAQWAEGGRGGLARPAAVLRGGREVMLLPGPEGFNSAIAVVSADGAHQIARATTAFERRFPDGVPAALLTERSARAQIEDRRAFRAHREALLAGFRAAGLTETEALLRANDMLEAEGLLPARPRLIAQEVQDVPEGVALFEVPQRYLDVGLMQDIAEAIALPGEAVLSRSGGYLVYAGDDLAPRIRAQRQADGRVAVRVGGRLFLIEDQ